MRVVQTLLHRLVTASLSLLVGLFANSTPPARQTGRAGGWRSRQARLALTGVAAAISLLAVVVTPADAAVLGLLGAGNNDSGQLCDGTTITPAAATTAGVGDAAAGVTAISAGENHSLFLKSDAVFACGSNGSGQLGNDDPAMVTQSTPVPVCAVGAVAPCTVAAGNNLKGITAIAAGGYYSLALTVTGTVLAWGTNKFGELGDGTNLNRLSPVPVCAVGAVAPCSVGINDLTGITRIAAGWNHALALSGNPGAVLAWGGNYAGEQCNGTTNVSSTPVPAVAPANTGVTEISAGGNHSLLLKGGTGGGGPVFACGLNNDGQLGDGTQQNRPTGVPVCAVGAKTPCDAAHANNLTGITAIAAGVGHSLFLAPLPGGAVFACGWNLRGQVGDNTGNDATSPVAVVDNTTGAPVPLTGVSNIAAGYAHSLALKGGQVYSWGWNNNGQLANGARGFQLAAVALVGANPLSAGVSGIAAGYAHSLFIK